MKAFAGLGAAAQMQRDVYLGLGISSVWICVGSFVIPTPADVGPRGPAVIMDAVDTILPHREPGTAHCRLQPVTVCEAGAVPIFWVKNVKIRAVR